MGREEIRTMGAAKELEPLDDDLREIVEQNMGLVYRIAPELARGG